MSRSPLDCELFLSSPGTARPADPREVELSCPLRLSGGQDTYGEAVFDPEGLASLMEVADDPEAYGRRLFRLLFPPASRQERGFRDLQSKARGQKRSLRFRLHLLANLPAAIHTLEWERLFDPESRQFLACSRETPFSRYCTVPRDPGEPTQGRARLLCVISAPRDTSEGRLPELAPLQIERLRTSLEALSPWIDIEILDSPVTPSRLRDALGEKPCHALHFFGHGLIHRVPAKERRADGPIQRASLVFENDDGTPCFLGEDKLAQLLGDQEELRLVTLVACHGGAPSDHDDNFSGMAGRLVEQGVPAVVGMCRAVTIDSGLLFTEHLYRALALTGRVDVAVNEARQQLYLEDSHSTAWSSPRLFMRLDDGRLWLPPHRDRWRLPTAAALATCALLAALAGGHVESAEVEMDLHTRGVGFVLDRDHEVIDRLPIEEIATSHLQAIELPRVLGDEIIRSTDIERHNLGLLLLSPGPPGAEARQAGFEPANQATGRSALNLQGKSLPAGTLVSIQQLDQRDGGDYQLLFRGPDSQFSIDVMGSVRLKLLHRPATMLFTPSSQAILVTGGDNDLVFDLSLSPGDAGNLLDALPIRRLELTSARVVHRLESSSAKEIDLVESCQVRFPATGETYSLLPGERLRFESSSGSLHDLRISTQGLHFVFRGQIVGLRAEGAHSAGISRDLMPSFLAASLGSRHAPAALAVLLLLASLAAIAPRLSQPARFRPLLLPGAAGFSSKNVGPNHRR